MSNATTVSPGQPDAGVASAVVPKKKRPGRPFGSANKRMIDPDQVRAALSPSPQSLVMTYVAFLSKHPSPPEATGFSGELILNRIDLLTANIVENKSLAQRIADVSGMSFALADKVVAGAAQITPKMIVVIAEKLGTTTDYLLTGRKARHPPATHGAKFYPDEKELLSQYRTGNDTAKAASMFHVALPRLLEAFPEEATARVIASLVHLHDAGAQDHLCYLPMVLGTFKMRTGRDPLEYLEEPTVFTPLHEAWGIYGPEQQPLVNYLV